MIFYAFILLYEMGAFLIVKFLVYACTHSLEHSSITTTIDVYGHLFPNKQRETADKLDGYFKKQNILFIHKLDCSFINDNFFLYISE